MIDLALLAHLDVCAASGCVRVGDRLYVVADDDVSLHGYSLTGTPLSALPLLPDVMPADATDRKRVKPDFEALASLPDGSLLVLGSGSTQRRERAVHVTLDRPDVRPRVVDCGPLFAALRSEFPELNLEGLVVHGQEVLLGQRGNGVRRDNAMIHLDLPGFLRDVTVGTLTAGPLRQVQRLELGDLDDVPLSLTDLALAEDGQVVFAAAAERTDDPVLDGECLGSVLGAMDNGRVVAVERLATLCKIEGIAALGGDRWAFVADGDDPTALAPLLSGCWGLARAALR